MLANQTTDLAYTASTGNATSYSIDWASLADQTSTPFVFASGGGSVTGITIPAGTAAGTYNGVMTITNGICSENINITVKVNENFASTNNCVTSTTKLYYTNRKCCIKWLACFRIFTCK
ncbi:hypothetical protein ACQ9BO_01500 [Flavobacterium sp. P21]|uniref:hypothetical protein n=1 Tax=Flavobacterium sp. P21 TaxID=3423948 RepID=UPI003D66931D